MDTTRAVAEHFVAHDIEAVTFVDTLDRVPFIHVTKQPSSDQSDLFGLDILTLIAYAASRTGALDLIEEALDLVDGEPVWVASQGLIDRLSRSKAPTVTALSDQLVTASASVTAEYRI